MGVILCVCKNWTDIVGVLYVLHCELKNNDRLYYTHNPPDTYNAIPHSGGTPTMQIYSHNVILYVYLLPQCTSCKLTPTHLQTYVDMDIIVIMTFG